MGHNIKCSVYYQITFNILEFRVPGFLKAAQVELPVWKQVHVFKLDIDSTYSTLY